MIIDWILEKILYAVAGIFAFIFTPIVIIGGLLWEFILEDIWDSIKRFLFGKREEAKEKRKHLVSKTKELITEDRKSRTKVIKNDGFEAIGALLALNALGNEHKDLWNNKLFNNAYDLVVQKAKGV